MARRFRLQPILLALCLCGTALVLPACGDDAPTEESNEFASVINDKASLRIDPLTSSSEIDFLDKGVSVQLIGRTEKRYAIGRAREYWYRIRMEDGVEGWIYGANLSIGDSAAQAGQGFDKEMLQRSLVGKWWEVRNDGTTGLRRLYFWSDGKYKYSYGKVEIKDIPEGTYEIVSETEIRFTPASGVGETVEIKKLGVELRLIGKDEERKISFRRAFLDPDAPEPDENGEILPDPNAPPEGASPGAPAAAPPGAAQ